jgi:hypothetical protein
MTVFMLERQQGVAGPPDRALELRRKAGGDTELGFGTQFMPRVHGASTIHD